MPNHYQNIVKIQGTPEQIKAVKGFCRNGENEMDFGNVIPVPESVEEVGEISSKITSVVEKLRDVPFSDSPLVRVLQEENRRNTVVDTSEWSDEEKKQLNATLKAFDETGHMYWYDWNINNWGTKWNAYSQKDTEDDQFHYETANGSSKVVIEALSKEFPDVTLTLTWASEDIGYSCGRLKYRNGEVLEAFLPEGGTNKAYELALELHPHFKDDFVLVDGKYEWKDE